MPKTTSKLFTFTGIDGKVYSFTNKEKKFCDEYLTNGGMRVEALLIAYPKVKSRKVASAIAYEYLLKPHLNLYITIKLKEYGFDDANVELQHLKLINQNGDLQAKKAGLDMFYKLKGSYAAQKIKVIDPNDELTDDELAEEIARRDSVRGSGKKPVDKKKAKSS